MKNIILIIFILSISHAAAAADIRGYDFNGLKLGSSQTSLSKSFPEFACYKDRTNTKITRCKGIMNFHRHPGVITQAQADVILTYKDQQLVSIDVSWFSEMFKKTLSAFKKFYGKPSKVTIETLEANSGDILENQKYFWISDMQSIAYERFHSNEQSSRILFTLKEYSDRVEQNPLLPQDIAKSVKQSNENVMVYWTDIAGKTGSGKQLGEDGAAIKDYFSKNGTLIEISASGTRKRGNWKLSNTGYLCMQWKNDSDCGQLKLNQDGSISFMRYNKEIRRYYQFETGNKLS